MKTAVQVDRTHYLFSNKALVSLIIPLIIEQLLAVLVGMADTIMIASVGEAAVSGVSLVDQVMVLFINIFGALATGGAVVAGQYLGLRRAKEGCQSCTQLIWFVTIIAVIVTGILYIGKELILRHIFGAITPEVYAHANTYLLIVTASVPFLAMYNAGAAVFRAMGNSEVPMKVSIIMNIINVGGNALFIYGFHWGTAGVAVPTLLSRMVAALVITGLLCNQKLILHIEKTWKYRLNWRMVKRILSIGVPNGLESSMFQLGKIIVLSLVSTFGTYAIAANAVANAVAMFQMLPGLALSMAVTTVIARCVGAGDYEQVKFYTKKLVLIAYAGLVIVNVIVVVALPVILKAYNLSDYTAELTSKILIFYAISTVLIWPLSFVLPGTFRAAGDVQACMIIAILSMWIFRIGFSYVLGVNFGMGLFGVWVAMVVDWIFRTICFIVRYYRGKWMKAALV